MLADTCKGHGADLLIEDWAKPFKSHLKDCHELTIFIITHDTPFGIFRKVGERGRRGVRPVKA